MSFGTTGRICELEWLWLLLKSGIRCWCDKPSFMIWVSRVCRYPYVRILARQGSPDVVIGQVPVLVLLCVVASIGIGEFPGLLLWQECSRASTIGASLADICWVVAVLYPLVVAAERTSWGAALAFFDRFGEFVNGVETAAGHHGCFDDAHIRYWRLKGRLKGSIPGSGWWPEGVALEFYSRVWIVLCYV
jgi:hypothetical protein